ncbi:MAG: LCP family protein [Lachnospira sp.]|nr:LCP family protein [Lachnospira sp.]
MIRNKIWRRIAAVVFLLTLAAIGYAAYRLIRLNMLPQKMLLAIGAAAAVLLVLCAFLLFKKGRHRNHIRQLRRILACVLCAALSGGSLYAADVAGRLTSTLDTTTNVQTEAVGTKVGVYVRSDDAAAAVTDIASDPAGILTQLGRGAADAAVTKLEAEAGSQVQLTETDAMTDLADLLYNGDVRSIVVKESYLSLLEDVDGYADYSSRMRLLREYTIDPEDDKDASVTITEVPEPELDAAEGAFVMYLSGSDTRDAGLPESSRSDVNILAVVNPDTHEVLLVNTPRDYYIPNPAGGGALDKLTHLGLNGVGNSMQGLADLYGISIPYYAQINFTGFETLIDAVGGVDVDSPYAFTTDTDGGATHVVQGMNHFSGAQALAFARERHALAAGDNERGRNQMLVIEAVIRKLTSGTTILTHYSSILESLSGMFRTNMSSDDLSTFVRQQLNSGAGWHVTRFAVSGYNDEQPSYSLPTPNYVMQPNWDSVSEAKNMIGEVLAGQTPQDS